MGQDTGGYDKARNSIQNGMQQQQQIANQAGQYFNPYMQAGQGALGAFQGALAQGQDPMALYNQMLSGYRESPEFNAQLQAGTNAANNAASASGMLGSGAEAQAAAGRAQDLRSQDVQNYLNSVMGLRNQYLQGQQSLVDTGMQGATGGANVLNNLGQDIGQGYTGIANSYIGQAQQPGWGSQLLGAAGTLGGAFLGGPGGAAVGNKIGQGLNWLFK
jgi:hypothetical protein